MSEEIVSPPFPTDTTTLPRLLMYLADLREWILSHRYWCNEMVMDFGGSAPLIPEPEEIPSIPGMETMTCLAIADIFRSYISLRQLREYWDSVIRLFEDSWDSPMAIRSRLRAFRMGFQILEDAFVLPERREARRERYSRESRKFMKDVMRKLGVPEELLGDGAHFGIGPEGLMLGTAYKRGNRDYLTEEELDDLFNPLNNDEEDETEGEG